jgi:uncharacterized membrane protein
LSRAFSTTRAPLAYPCNCMRNTTLPSILFILSLLGLLIAGYLISTRIGNVELVCVTGSDCRSVQHSPYLNPFGISVSFYGALFYLAMIGIAAGLLSGKDLVRWALGLGIFGVLFAGYVTYAQGVLIGQFCFWCVVQAVILSIIFLIGVQLFRSRSRA